MTSFDLAFDPDAWVIAANCNGRTELFFAPDDSESRAERRQREAQAKAVCRECAVRTECLDEALSSDERFGIWGGHTERERRAMKRARSSAPSTASTAQDIAGPGRLARLPAVVVQGRAMSSSPEGEGTIQ
jgi:WhiB family transcriptional regulator, redox-sensing transcriptional regulator